MPDSPRSDRFRARVAETYSDLSPADVEAVEEVAHMLDFLDRLREEIGSGPLTENRQGGRRIRPEVVELRLQQATLDRMLRRFPDVDDEVA